MRAISRIVTIIRPLAKLFITPLLEARFYQKKRDLTRKHENEPFDRLRTSFED